MLMIINSKSGYKQKKN